MGGGGEFLDFMEGHSYYEGGHRPHGGIPQSPLGKTLYAVVYQNNLTFKNPKMCSTSLIISISTVRYIMQIDPM